MARQESDALLRYPYLHAAGKYYGSNESYVAQEVVRAAKDKAPWNAVWWNSAYERWQVIDALSPATQTVIERLAVQFHYMKPEPRKW